MYSILRVETVFYPLIRIINEDRDPCISLGMCASMLEQLLKQIALQICTFFPHPRYRCW